jgi:hypothetical protein
MRSHRKLTIAAALLATVAICIPASARINGPDYQALKACLANCIATTDPWTVARALCGADCVADYVDSKLSIASTNGGDGTLDSLAEYVVVDVPRNFLALDLDTSGDPIISIDWYLVRPGNTNPAPLGSGFSIGLIPAQFSGDPDGYLVADATRQSGAEAVHVLYVGAVAGAPPLPGVSTWLLILLIAGLAISGIWMIARRRATAIA